MTKKTSAPAGLDPKANAVNVAELLEFIKKDRIKDFLNVEEAAEYLAVSKNYIYGLTAERVIPFYKPSGKLIYFKRAELDAWINANRVCTNAEINARAIRAII